MFGITFKVSGYQVFKLSQSLFIWCYKNKRNKKSNYMQRCERVYPRAEKLHRNGVRSTKNQFRRCYNIGLLKRRVRC